MEVSAEKSGCNYIYNLAAFTGYNRALKK